ncbi:MAG: isoleucine--tRNA ligase [Candidatus Woesearchaeota archaeon]
MDFRAIEHDIIAFWDENDIYPKLKELRSGGDPFYYLDGPPYTSGAIHIGHAWGKILRDMVMRVKRMQGYDVFDRAGFDMHGLPTSHKVEAKFGINGKAGIADFGAERFTEECKKLAVEKMHSMIEDFRRIGVWMDFDDPYLPITNEYIEGVWWFIKKAHEKGRLYEGLRTLHWDPKDQTALAKHELEYRQVTDESIFVRFKTSADESLLVWTTTPWTIPYNLAVMVNPDVEYSRVRIDGEVLIVASELAEQVMGKSGHEYEVVSTITGSELEGTKYEHPLAHLIPQFKDMKAEALHSVVLSREHVETSSGSGLVHCAPGCGPEDYEVGHAYGLTPFNTVDESGVIRDVRAPLEGLRAKSDDARIVSIIEDSGALFYREPYVHDYPFAERSKTPVVFRVTPQWFLRVEDLKERMKELNSDVHWNPEWAGKNQFHNWIDQLRDNSITKQIHWGTPLPVWRADDEIVVVGSADELRELGADVPDELHKPYIDDVTFTRDGKTFRRIPDVLDVWVDAGAAAWLALDYPKRTDLFERYYPADFITEGKDQIRGWFNLLAVQGIIAFDQIPFKAVYMQGFINDAQGRKMSKSLGNIISPNEVIERYGADVMRFYMVSAANPGLDMNYNFEDIEARKRSLLVLSNLYSLLEGRLGDLGLEKAPDLPGSLDVVSRAMLSRVHVTVENTLAAWERYELDRIPGIIESLYLTLSRFYVQFKRDELASEAHTPLAVIAHALRHTTVLLAPVVPHLAEHLYRTYGTLLGFDGVSVHHEPYPEPVRSYVDLELEAGLDVLEGVRQAALSARESTGHGIRWPLRLLIVVSDRERLDALKPFTSDLAVQLNVKSIELRSSLEGVEPLIEPDKGVIGRTFKQDSKRVLELLSSLGEKDVARLASSHEVVLGGFAIGPGMVSVSYTVPEGFASAPFEAGSVYLSSELDDELAFEGYAREFTRHVQNLRKEAGLERSEQVTIAIDEQTRSFFSEALERIAERVNARFVTGEADAFSVRDRSFAARIT